MNDDHSAVSFRDPEGCVYLVNGRVLRFLHASSAAPIVEFVQSSAAADLVRTGRLISSVTRNSDELDVKRQDPGVWLEHPPVWFPSFPFEWPPEMLYEAGMLTLTIAEQALKAGFELKDATPFNVLFNGSRPVWIDVSSFQIFDARILTWQAYAQFVQSFVLPLLVGRLTGLRTDWMFAQNRDGINPAELSEVPGLWRSRAGIEFVLLPRLLERKRSQRPAPIRARPGQESASRFVRQRLYRGLKKTLQSLHPPQPPNTDITRYTTERSGEEQEQSVRQAKHASILAAERCS